MLFIKKLVPGDVPFTKNSTPTIAVIDYQRGMNTRGLIYTVLVMKVCHVGVFVFLALIT
jgi:hypothetical protein